MARSRLLVCPAVTVILAAVSACVPGESHVLATCEDSAWFGQTVGGLRQVVPASGGVEVTDASCYRDGGGSVELIFDTTMTSSNDLELYYAKTLPSHGWSLSRNPQCFTKEIDGRMTYAWTLVIDDAPGKSGIGAETTSDAQGACAPLGASMTPETSRTAIQNSRLAFR